MGGFCVIFVRIFPVWQEEAHLGNNSTNIMGTGLKFDMNEAEVVLYQNRSLFGPEIVRFLCYLSALFLFLAGGWPFRE